MTKTAKYHVVCHIYDPERRGKPHCAMMKFGQYVPSYEAAEWLETTGFKYMYVEITAEDKNHRARRELRFHFFSLYEAQLFAMAFGLTVEDHDG